MCIYSYAGSRFDLTKFEKHVIPGTTLSKTVKMNFRDDKGAWEGADTDLNSSHHHHMFHTTAGIFYLALYYLGSVQ